MRFCHPVAEAVNHHPWNGFAVLGTYSALFYVFSKGWDAFFIEKAFATGSRRPPLTYY